MKATSYDASGRNRKLKDLVPGKCSFPFKYRRKDVYTCQERKDGKWCATSTDNGKVKTWGFCHPVPKQTKKKPTKCPPGKVRNPKTGRCINKPKKKLNCPPGKVRNPKTGRCINVVKVKPSGKVKPNKELKPLKKNTKKQNKNNSIKKEKLPKVERNNILQEIQTLGKGVDCSIFSNPDSRLVFLGKGVANRVYLSCLNPVCKRRVAVRIMSIDNYIPYTSILHPNRIELEAYNTFNKLLSSNKTAHIPYKIKNIKCKISSLKNSLISSALDTYVSSRDMGAIKPDLDILLTEYCKFGTSYNFLKKNMRKLSDKDLKIFIFQYISGLVTLQYHLPGFKHNDIHCENILVGTYNLKEQTGFGTNKYIKYVLFGKEFYIPLREYCVKIYDFDTMSTHRLRNMKLDDDIYREVGVTPLNNPVFDFHLGINSMFKLNSFYPSHVQSKDFYERNIPSRLRGNDNQYLYYSRLTNFYQTRDYDDTNFIPHDVQTPSDVLLNDKYFDEFRVKPAGAVIVDVIDSKIPGYEQVKDLKYMFK